MTAAEKIILAVADATGDDLGVQLTETNMAIICWRRFPSDFGVRIDTTLLDTKRFSTVLFGQWWRLKEFLTRVSKGRYSLTVEGLREAERLRGLK